VEDGGNAQRLFRRVLGNYPEKSGGFPGLSPRNFLPKEEIPEGQKENFLTFYPEKFRRNFRDFILEIACRKQAISKGELESSRKPRASCLPTGKIARGGSLLVIVFVLNFIAINAIFSQDNSGGISQERRNPFKDCFPVIKVEPEKVEEQSIVVEQKPSFDPSIYNVDGIIWGAYKPRVIINNQIYGIGDKLGEAEIKKISKEGVTLIFEEEEYAITTRQVINVLKTNTQKETENANNETQGGG
jgi:hypothetical protein